ncbi:hypothetical protein MKZ38_004095 [Zalerion maritima]|uniref:ASX DEUBAD domain-containing protein n=1 Tax=Zalerion maritima TaxID=339359 RepID=A0AAD5WV37_9PEZI|nr:hypothetical protein MKZ38_004095 [Zalerion maritima]
MSHSNSGSSSPLSSVPPSPSHEGRGSEHSFGLLYTELQLSEPEAGRISPQLILPGGPEEAEIVEAAQTPTTQATKATATTGKRPPDTTPEPFTKTIDTPTASPKKRRLKPQLISETPGGHQQEEVDVDKKRNFNPHEDGPAKKRKVLKRPGSARKELAKKGTKLPATVPRKLKKWQPDFVTQDTKSTLANQDIRAILSHPKAWSCLSDEDKKEILALFPDNQHILNPGTAAAAPNIATLRSDDTFRYDCARIAEHIADGRHDPQWLQEAWTAHERNQAGEFEEFEERAFEEDWGVKLPESMKKSGKKDMDQPKEEAIASNEKDMIGKTKTPGKTKTLPGIYYRDGEDELASSPPTLNGEYESKTVEVPSGKLDDIVEEMAEDDENKGGNTKEEDKLSKKAEGKRPATNGLKKWGQESI